MEIKKEIINLRSKDVRLNSNVCAEGDIIVPDIKPDIREILLADAVATITSEEYKNGKLYISGKVNFTVLYKPETEDGECVKSIKTSIDFSESADISGGEDLRFYADAKTEHIGFTLVNSRKLSVKVIVSVEINGYKDETFSPISEITDCCAQSKCKGYNIYMPVADVKEEIQISDFLTVPENMPDIDEILKVEAFASGGECKVMNGKVMVKGTLNTNTLYRPTDAAIPLMCAYHQIPFTEIIEAEGADENSVANVSFCVCDTSAQARGDMNGDTKIISAEFLVNARLKVSKTVEKRVVDDCYGINKMIKTEKENVKILEFVTADRTGFSETQQVKMPKNSGLGEIVSVSVKPMVRDTYIKDGEVCADGTLVSFLLYTEEGKTNEVKSAVTESDFTFKRAVRGLDRNKNDLIIECDINAEETYADKVNSETAEVKAQLLANFKVLKTNEIRLIKECEMYEKESENEHPCGLVIYFTKEGDTLWDVAKRYETTTEKIKRANAMEDKTSEDEKLMSGRRILIPKAV